MKCPDCAALMDRHDAGSFNDRWECPFDQQIAWATPHVSPIPSYEEAIDESHRPGHEWLWEPCGDGRACKLCGHIERAVDGG